MGRRGVLPKKYEHLKSLKVGDVAEVSLDKSELAYKQTQRIRVLLSRHYDEFKFIARINKTRSVITCWIQEKECIQKKR